MNNFGKFIRRLFTASALSALAASSSYAEETNEITAENPDITSTYEDNTEEPELLYVTPSERAEFLELVSELENKLRLGDLRGSIGEKQPRYQADIIRDILTLISQPRSFDSAQDKRIATQQWLDELGNEDGALDEELIDLLISYIRSVSVHEIFNIAEYQKINGFLRDHHDYDIIRNETFANFKYTLNPSSFAPFNDPVNVALADDFRTCLKAHWNQTFEKGDLHSFVKAYNNLGSENSVTYFYSQKCVDIIEGKLSNDEMSLIFQEITTQVQPMADFIATEEYLQQFMDGQNPLGFQPKDFSPRPQL
jgi:hypothetical protein